MPYKNSEAKLRANRAWRERNREQVHAYNREYQKSYRKTEHGKRKRAAWAKTYRNRNVEKARADSARWYRANKDKARTNARAHAKRKDQFVRELKEKRFGGRCHDCGDTFPYHVLDFDHRDPTQKEFVLSKASTRSYDAILAEVAKCDLVCANCHRIRTHEQHKNGDFDDLQRATAPHHPTLFET